MWIGFSRSKTVFGLVHVPRLFEKGVCVMLDVDSDFSLTFSDLGNVPEGLSKSGTCFLKGFISTNLKKNLLQNA